MTYLPELLKRKRFDSNLINELLMSEFQHESDNVAVWLEDDEKIIYSQAMDKSVYSRKALAYQLYKQWCHDSNHRPLTNQKFYKRLIVNGFTFGKKENMHVVFGLTFKSHQKQVE